MCLGWEYGKEGLKDNVYGNPFRNATAFFKTDRGHGLRVSELRYGAIPLAVRGQWYGTKMSFFMKRQGESFPTTLTARDKSSQDEAGFAYQEALLQRLHA
jgi:hypothetical protein